MKLVLGPPHVVHWLHLFACLVVHLTDASNVSSPLFEPNVRCTHYPWGFFRDTTVLPYGWILSLLGDGVKPSLCGYPPNWGHLLR